MDWENIDILHREKNIDDIIQVIDGMKKYPNNGFILVNGEWGSGKTTLLEKLKEKINDDNNVIEYNCWKNSFYPDPLIAIISSITDQTDKDSDINKLGIDLMRYFRPSISSVSILGFDIKWARKQENEEYISLEKYIEDFRKKLNEFNKNNIGKDNKRARVILVDELDRCLPEYAIKVLERLYLLFKGVNDVIVVIATDKIQLKHSIKTIFGLEFDLNIYLKKFVDFTYELNYGFVDNNNISERFQNYFKLFKTNDYNDVNNLISYFISKEPIRETVMKINNIKRLHDICLKNHDEYFICIFELMLAFVDKDFLKEIYKKVSTYLENFPVKYKNSMERGLCENIISLSDRFYKPGNELDPIQKGYQLYLQYLYHKNIIDNNFNNVIEQFFINRIVNVKNENMEIVNSTHEYLIQKNKG